MTVLDTPVSAEGGSLRHPAIDRFGRAGGELLVGGVPLRRLAARIGSTPFFAYDRAILTERVQDLRRALPDKVHLSYAMKANPMPEVVLHLAGLVDSIDVASALEMQTALNSTMPAENISFAGPGKVAAELRQAVAAGVMIELESETELRRVHAAGQELGVRPRVALRVNPDFAVKGSGMRMGGGSQQFGVDAESIPDMLKLMADLDVEHLGYHVFAGSQNLRAEILSEAQTKTVDLVVQLAGYAPWPVKYLNLGGGFGIPYFPKDVPLDLETVAANLQRLVDGPIAQHLPEAKVVIELGRYIVGECGVYVTEVVDKKISRGKTYLVVDGGMHHQLAASGNFGQVIRRNYPLAIGTRMSDAIADPVSVVGCLCTPLDLLGDQVDLPPAEIGDLVVIFQQGAYGLTASPIAFLGHPPPAEVLL